MDSREPFFWMQGILATGLAEVTSDPHRLDSGGFWVVAISFEGEGRFARFTNVERGVPFPAQEKWQNLETLWRSSFDQAEYEEYVRQIRDSIADGLVYQVNACRTLSTPAPNISLAPFFTKILERNPAPLASFLRLPELEIASASPELFLRRTGLAVTTSPIKGTQPLGSAEEFGTKDQSENIMIVDLMRNDLSRICEVGTVTVGELLRQETHPGLRHLVSDVHGTLISEISWDEIFEALMPPGSVSGAPKSSALEVIRRSEKVPRGIYCGALGWIEGDQACLSVAIRTFWRQSDHIFYGTGAGITWGSNPRGEWQETELKANHLLGLAGGVDVAGWQYGNGIFETLLVEDGHPMLFAQHMARAEKSAAQLGILIPARAEILEAIKSSMNYPVARLRLSFGETFTFAVDAHHRSDEALHIRILDCVKSAGTGPHKRFPFHDNLDLLRTARADGFDEVLLVDQAGTVGEGATCNYIFFINGEWITPTLSSGVLPGIMRALAIENALVTELDLKHSDLIKIESMMALSSLRIALSVARLDNRPLLVGPKNELLYERLLGLTRSHSVG